MGSRVWGLGSRGIGEGANHDGHATVGGVDGGDEAEERHEVRLRQGQRRRQRQRTQTEIETQTETETQTHHTR
eukprot:714946-Rhodomonas_salina.1